MLERTHLERITDENVGDFLEAERAVLVLARSTCACCVTYEQQIQAQIERGALDAVRIGQLVLDRPGSLQFKRANPWLAGLIYLPRTLLYQGGQQVDAFDTDDGSVLVQHVRAALGTPSET